MTTKQDLYSTSAMTPVKPDVICDTECYPNFWSIGFKRLRDGKLVILEKSHRQELDVDRLLSIMLTHRIITFNGQNYDLPMIFKALAGASNAELKQANDKIINGKLKYWQVEEALGITVPRKVTVVDLIEPQPNAFASLKILAGRMHAPKMQDLPFDPDHPLTDEQMDIVLSYMGNDLDNTDLLWQALAEPMALRAALGAEYGMNFMSKSDSQIGEAIVKKEVERVTGDKVERVNTPPGTSFPYRVPAYLSFEHPELRKVVERLRETEFYVQGDGSVELPTWLDGKTVDLGESTYAMGIGGLHSTEKNRALHSDDDFVLVDFDVASYYPRIIINSGLYPKALGPAFIPVYTKIVDDRVAAKHRMQEIEKIDLPALRAQKADTEEAKSAIKKRYLELQRELTECKVRAEGLKISANGVFGKLGSVWSVLYAPHLMIAVTLTGQLALLMLIDRAERAGIQVVSANTDGVVFRVPRSMLGEVEKTRVTDGPVKELIEQWERDTGFTMEATKYRSIYNASVNSYIAVKEDGSAKLKGPVANPWRSGDGHKPDLRAQLMKNPQMTIVSNAVVDFLTKGIPIEETVNACQDIRDFITVVKVDGGAVWNGRAANDNDFEVNVGIEAGTYLGKVVRYYWSTQGAEILRAKGHHKTGTHGKVGKTDSCRPLMELPGDLAVPDDLDRSRYVEAAREVLMDYGAQERPPPIKPLRIFKYNAIGWFAVAA